MTVSTLTNKVTYIGNGSATEFAVPFKILDEDHLVVKRRLLSSNEIDKTYIGTEYSYSGVGASSGTLTLAGTALSGLYQLEIERIVPYTQELDLVNAGGFYPETVEEQLDLMTMGIQQIDAQSDDLLQRALLVPVGQTAPSYADFADAFKGDPGGNTMAIGLFTAASALTIPDGTDLVQTSGYSVDGKGMARYSYDEDVDAAYVTDNPLTSFMSANDRGFKLAEHYRTPYMFGALGHYVSESDFTDDSEALQAFFDDAFSDENAVSNIYDWQGKWPVASPILALYPINTVRRTFICGTLRVLPVAEQPGGVPMEYVLTIGGTDNVWLGLIHIDGNADTGGSLAYTARKFKNGVRLFNTSKCIFDQIAVGCAQRDGVFFDPTNTTTTFRAGTDYEVEYGNSNNIATKIGHVYGRVVGSSRIDSNLWYYSTTFTAIDQGGTADADVTFDTSSAAYVSSTQQRSRVTVTTSDEFELYDRVRVRIGADATSYTTIAADNTAGTFTWAAGNPVTAGFAVGDFVIPASGINAGRKFEILSFSGTSNRVITVNPKPQTEAATALTSFVTDWTYHQIMNIPDSTTIDVYPWIPDRHAAGTIFSAHGAVVNLRGGNTANVSIGFVGGIGISAAVNCGCLYGPVLGTILAEGATFGILLGQDPTASCVGTVWDHMHAEGCEVPIFGLSVQAGNAWLGRGMAEFTLSDCRVLSARSSTSVALENASSFANCSLFHDGNVYTNGILKSNMGDETATINNTPTQRHRVIVSDGNPALVIDFDEVVARLFGGHIYASCDWYGIAAPDPAGTMTFTISDELTHRGWSLVGASSTSAPSGPVHFRIGFDTSNKQVTVMKLVGA